MKNFIGDLGITFNIGVLRVTPELTVTKKERISMQLNQYQFKLDYIETYELLLIYRNTVYIYCLTDGKKNNEGIIKRDICWNGLDVEQS